MSHTARAAKFRNVIARMTNNQYFPEPWKTKALSIPILTNAADRYDSGIIAASRGDRDNIAMRNEILEEIQELMDQLANYVELEAGGNMAALRSTGFDLRRVRSKTITPHPPAAILDLRVENMPQPGKVTVYANGSEGAISREVQYTTGNPLIDSDWASKGVFPPNLTIEMDGFTSDQNHFFRIRDISEHGLGPWSNSASTFVT